MLQLQLFAANYNPEVMWVYDELRCWLAERNVELILANCTGPDEAIEKAQQADIFLAYKFQMSRKIISALPRLKLLMASGSGYDHLDIQAATEQGVMVTCGLTHNVEDVAEHTVMLLMACSHKLRFLEQTVRAGVWPAGSAGPARHRLAGQVVGLIGFGRIARAVAWRVKGLGCRVLVYDPYVPAAAIEQQDAEPVELEVLLSQADFVSLHLRLSAETRHLLGEAHLKRMKDSAVVVNTSRGGVIDEAALIHALRQGRIAGAGLDVLEQEPPDLDNPLLAMDNVIVTGHAAGSSVESLQDWQDEWRRIIEDFLAGYWPINVVNPTVQPKISLKHRP